MSAIRNIFIIIYLLGWNCLLGQTDAHSKHALLELTKSAEEYKQYELAIEYCKAYLEKDPGNWKIQLRLANNLRLNRSYKEAEKAYKNLIENPKNKSKLASYFYAEMLKINGNCQAAIPVFLEFRKIYRGEKDDLKYRRLAKNQIEGCSLDKAIDKNSELYVQALPHSINSLYMESGPFFYEKGMIYASDREISESSIPVQEAGYPTRQFYYSEFHEGNWENPIKWTLLNSMQEYHLMNGAFNFEKTRFYFSACKSNKRFDMECDIYVLNLDNHSIERLPDQVNSKNLETQVAVGKDEKNRELIYFVSDRKDGKGGFDLWYTRYSEKKDEYREARNCGSKVNSVGDEWTPFIHPRNRVLFFSSNGHPGYGGLDVFQSIGNGSRWEEPVNKGYSINTEKDQLYYVEHPIEDYGLFISNQDVRKGKQASCCDDLYVFQKKADVLIDLNVKTRSSEPKNESIKDVKLKVYHLGKSGEKYLEQELRTDAVGNINLKLEPKLIYLIRAEKDGYLSEEQTIDTRGEKNGLPDQVFLLDKISAEAIVIENIYYEFDRSVLTEEAKITIDTTIYEVLIKNPEIIVELSSHTDGKGTKNYNKKLSQLRAESVVKYLMKKGIQKERMIAKGCGMEKPIAQNRNPDGSDNPEGRAKNRRTEFKIIGKLKIDEED